MINESITNNNKNAPLISKASSLPPPHSHNFFSISTERLYDPNRATEIMVSKSTLANGLHATAHSPWAPSLQWIEKSRSVPSPTSVGKENEKEEEKPKSDCTATSSYAKKDQDQNGEDGRRSSPSALSPISTYTSSTSSRRSSLETSASSNPHSHSHSLDVTEKRSDSPRSPSGLLATAPPFQPKPKEPERKTDESECQWDFKRGYLHEKGSENTYEIAEEIMKLQQCDGETPGAPRVDKGHWDFALDGYFAPQKPLPVEGPSTPSLTLKHLSTYYLTDPDDLLYTQARQTFVSQSLSSLSSSSNSLTRNQQALMAHFDRAMHSPSPLAALYGLGREQAERILKEGDETRSGVSRIVLELVARFMSARNAGTYTTGAGWGMGGPSANNRKLGLFKTELCRSWEEQGSCRYGVKCQFAHGHHEVREVARHPKFKSEICRTFFTHGSCPYGRRCCFIHTTVLGGPAPSGPPPDFLANAINTLTLDDRDARSSTSSGSSSNGNGNGAGGQEYLTSRLSKRMSEASSQSLAQSNGAGFGPALANYLGPNQSHSQSSIAMEQGGGGGRRDLFINTTSTSDLFGAGYPVAAPKAYQAAPQSRLQRLNLDSTLTRHASTGSHSSSSSNANYSPLLPRADSSSSLSSLGGNSSYGVGTYQECYQQQQYYPTVPHPTRRATTGAPALSSLFA